jgi:hypothetical protein
MEIIESQDTHEIKYDKNSNIVSLKLFKQELDLDTFRNIWDQSIEVVKSKKSCKVLFDTRDTSFSNIENLLYTTEGLVQIMCNEIKARRLYFAYILNDNCNNSLKHDIKIHPQFNQFNEIEYDFFKDSFDATSWLLQFDTKSYVKSLSLFLGFSKTNKKTTTEIQTKKVEEILKIDINDPLYQLYKSIMSDDNKYKKNK